VREKRVDRVEGLDRDSLTAQELGDPLVAGNRRDGERRRATGGDTRL
jgi:hypothetical protein